MDYTEEKIAEIAKAYHEYREGEINSCSSVDNTRELGERESSIARQRLNDLCSNNLLELLTSKSKPIN